jgi:translation initiation factor 1
MSGKDGRARGGLVYSTERRVCPKCGWPAERCACSKASVSSGSGDGIVRVGRETKGRAGKGVTIVTGVPLGGDDLARLAGELKKRCGSGGTIKEGTIEIQGDHRDLLVAELERRGWKVKRSGG